MTSCLFIKKKTSKKVYNQGLILVNLDIDILILGTSNLGAPKNVYQQMTRCFKFRFRKQYKIIQRFTKLLINCREIFHSNCFVHVSSKWGRPITFLLLYCQRPNYFPGSTPDSNLIKSAQEWVQYLWIQKTARPYIHIG